MTRNLCAALCALVSFTCASAERDPARAVAPAPSTGPATPSGEVHAQPSATSRAAVPAPVESQDPELQSLRVLLENAREAKDRGDFAGSRAQIASTIEKALEVTGGREDAEAVRLLEEMGTFAREAGDLHAAETSRRRVVEILSRTLPEHHPDLARARSSLASTLYELGDGEGARALQEQVLEVLARSLPEDHPDLQSTRGNLAVMIRALGDLQGARALQEKVLEVSSRTLPGDHPSLQAARLNLANTLFLLGDLQTSRGLQEKVLEVLSRTLPGDHPDLQKARQSFAITLVALGELQDARALEQQVLEVRSRTLPEDHPDLQWARLNHAATLKALGDLQGARALEEKAIEVFMRTLPAEHPDLTDARANLANTLRALGDVRGARALQEEVLQIDSRRLPDDHPTLALARLNLAGTLKEFGEFARARTLEEKVLEVRSSVLPADHPDVQTARHNLAATLFLTGDLQGARALWEQVFEVLSLALPADHPDLSRVRTNLAAMTHALGDLQGARTLGEQVLEAFLRTLPADHPDVQSARVNLAWMLAHQIAEAIRAQGGEGGRVAGMEGERERCAELVLAMCRVQTEVARRALLEGSPREAEERCVELSEYLAESLSIAGGLGRLAPMRELERASFELSETTRGAPLSSAALMRTAAEAGGYRDARDALRRRSQELTELVQGGATSEQFREALALRDEAQRELVGLARGLEGGIPGALAFDVERLHSVLSDRDAIVAYRRYQRSMLEETGSGPLVPNAVDSLCAFVLRTARASEAVRERPDARDELSARVPTAPVTLVLVDLGPIERVEGAVRSWRAGLGVSTEARGVGEGSSAAAPRQNEERGRALRNLVLDPLRESLAGTDHVVFILDDVLHVVPLDALPADDRAAADGTERLGDQLRIETRVTLTELLDPPTSVEARDELVVVGGVAYGAGEEGGASATAGEDSRSDENAGILRGGAWSGGFADLPATADEARSIARELEERGRSGSSVTLLQGGDANRENLIQAAPRARWLHVATHGWFAPESIRSRSEPDPIDAKLGLGMFQSAEEQVKGMSPMLLCGFALAGANRVEDSLGHVPGLVTAEEIAALDLSHCELAVLSACDTNVGERRAGQGVASLQRALQMAGARSVITSLWKVPDGATKELMTDFYRRLWVETKPKWQALWEAKKKLREAKDDSGRLRYTTRDWAAWVLTGEPE